MRLLVALLCLIPPALAADDEPVLLVKRPGCFVHAVEASPPVTEHVERLVASGPMLLHTDRESGAMKRLGPAGGIVAVSTVRVSYAVTRILGVAADDERLYVLAWRSGRIFDRPPAADAPLEGGTYTVSVFALAGGAEQRTVRLTGKGVPAAAPAPSLGAGPLKLVEGGVACYGEVVR